MFHLFNKVIRATIYVQDVKNSKFPKFIFQEAALKIKIWILKCCCAVVAATVALQLLICSCCCKLLLQLKFDNCYFATAFFATDTLQLLLQLFGTCCFAIVVATVILALLFCNCYCNCCFATVILQLSLLPLFLLQLLLRQL